MRALSNCLIRSAQVSFEDFLAFLNMKACMYVISIMNIPTIPNRVAIPVVLSPKMLPSTIKKTAVTIAFQIHQTAESKTQEDNISHIPPLESHHRAPPHQRHPTRHGAAQPQGNKDNPDLHSTRRFRS